MEDDLLTQVSNTMADRCVTNSAVDNLIEVEAGKPVNSFRCGVHPLDAFTHEVNAIFKEDDKKRSAPKGFMPYEKAGRTAHRHF